MKKLLLILGIFTVVSAGAYWWAIVEVQRSPATVQVDDARLRIWYNLVAPNYADTTAANTNLGLDYIGALIHTKTPAAIYFRDTSAAHHKWTILATTPASPIWGLITGTLSSQTDLQTALNAKQNLIALGTTAQYFRGDLSLATFPTDLSSFTNGPAYLASVSVTNSITGNGTSGTPLKLVNDAASPGANQYYGTDNGGAKHWLPNSPILNIYNHDGTLLGDRTLSGSNLYSLKFDSLFLFQVNAAGYIFNAISPGNNTQWNMDAASSTISISDNPFTKSSTELQSIDSLAYTVKNSSGSHTSTFKITEDSILFKQTGGLFYFYTPPSANDTSLNKPVAFNLATKTLRVMDGWAGSGGGGSSFTRQAITSGSSGTVTGGKYIVTFNPSSVIAAYTLTLPASPSDMDEVEIEAGGTITGGATVVTALTISPNSGQTIHQLSTPTTINDGETIKYRYRTANTAWYRKL